MSAASIDLRAFGDDLLTNLLVFAMNAIKGSLGAGLSIAVDLSNDQRCVVVDQEPDPAASGDLPRTVAAVGVASVLDPAQWRQSSGPLWEAFRTGTLIQVPGPLETATPPAGLDLGTLDGTVDRPMDGLMDEAAPGTAPAAGGLGLDALPGIDSDVMRDVKGAVFSAGEWGGELPVILSVYLDRPADARTLRDIDKYEPVITQALSLVEYCAGEEHVAQQMLQMTQYRRVIEQAKGLVMGATGSDATAAFATLVRASQHFNVRLRHLAVALVEHIGGDGTAEHPEDPTLVIEPSGHERQVAGRVWAALTTPSLAHPLDRQG